MELRVLRYFLAVVRSGNFSKAAQSLHLTQPTLSRQIHELEEELGVQLFIREKRGIELTSDGAYLADRAREILDLADRTKNTLSASSSMIAGDVRIACGESRGIRILAEAINRTRAKYPGIRFVLFSGNARAVACKLEKGLADIGLFIGAVNLGDYEYFRLPVEDEWGLLLREDHPLASKANIGPEDLNETELLCSNQEQAINEIAAWTGSHAFEEKIIATYNLLYNAAQLVRSGTGAAICIDGIANTSDGSGIVFRPFKPKLTVSLTVAWKRDKIFSPATNAYLKMLGSVINQTF